MYVYIYISIWFIHITWWFYEFRLADSKELFKLQDFWYLEKVRVNWKSIMKKHWRVLGTLPVRIPKRGHTIGTFGTMWMRMDLKMLWQQGWYNHDSQKGLLFEKKIPKTSIYMCWYRMFQRFQIFWLHFCQGSGLQMVVIFHFLQEFHL